MLDAALDPATVAATYIYPIKACAALAVPALRIDRWGGAEGDRRWAIVNAEAAVTWQGEYPRLALIAPQLLGDAGLLLRAPGRAPLAVDGEATLRGCDFTIWNEQLALAERFAGEDAGEDAAAWVSAVVGAPLRLVRLGEAALARPTLQRLHLLSLESCRAVDAALAGRHQAPADPLRYRPNVLLQGRNEPLQPFVEDHLLQMLWPLADATARLEVVARCLRCVVPDVDPASGQLGTGVLETLAELSAQRLPAEAVSLGVYGRASVGARLEQGQEVGLRLSF